MLDEINWEMTSFCRLIIKLLNNELKNCFFFLEKELIIFH